MSSILEKIHKVKRLESLETNMLHIRSAELARVESALSKLVQEQELIRKRIGEMTLIHERPSVDELQQVNAFADQLEGVVRTLEQAIECKQQERDSVLSEVIAQRTKVKGLETYIERLNTDLRISESRSGAAEADDRYLNLRLGTEQ